MKNEFMSQSLAEAFAEHRARLLSLVEKRLNPVLNKRLSHEDVMQEVYLAAAKRLPYFAQNEDVPIYFKLRTILLQTLADIERKNLQAAGRDAYREAEVGDDTTSERAPGALNWGRFAADGTSPLSRVDRDERHAVLRAAVAALPENDRAIIILRHFDGMGNSACAAALAVGYMKTSCALAATEQEAASAAQSLAKAVAEIDRSDSDRRDAEIVRALTAAERLAERFPGNAEIADAVERLKAARDAHARFLERRGGAMRLQHRFRSALRHEQ